MDCVNESKADFWPKQIEDWKNSGLSQAGYCRQSGLKESRFYYWRKRLEGRPQRTTKKLKPNFMDLTPKYSKSEALQITINGMTIQFDRLPDPRWVSELYKNFGRGSDVLH